MIPAKTPDHAADCQRCPLAQFRQHVVWGEGPVPASIVLLAEAPGAIENQKARPMVGQAGKVLDWLLDLAELPRPTVYIANRVKCQPPGNRLDQYPMAVGLCRPWLDEELAEVKPKVIVALGDTAAREWMPGMLVREFTGVARVVSTGWGQVTVIGCYHPSALARDRGNTVMRDRMVAALRRAKHEAELTSQVQL